MMIDVMPINTRNCIGYSFSKILGIGIALNIEAMPACNETPFF